MKYIILIFLVGCSTSKEQWHYDNNELLIIESWSTNNIYK